MSDDSRDLIEVLKCELRFLEDGGYRRSLRTPWKATSIFIDSPSCPNFNDPARPVPCTQCCLIDCVPVEFVAESVPCHFIPLNGDGETVDSMQRQAHQSEMEEAVKHWLREAIAKLERGQVISKVH